jgi:uncharacterized membrane protein
MREWREISRREGVIQHSCNNVLHSDFRRKAALYDGDARRTGPRRTVTEIHLVTGVAVMALNLVTGLWGALAWYGDRPSVSFWYLLRLAQISVVVQVTLGALLLVSGREAVDALHYMYGTAPLLISLVAEGMRAGAAAREVPEGVAFESLPVPEQRAVALRILRREMATMAIACLLIVAFAVRAAQVSGELF